MKLVLLLFAVGLLLAAGLRPLVGPVSRRFGLVRANFAGALIPTAGGWVIVVAVAAGVAVARVCPWIAVEEPARAAGEAFAAAAVLFGLLGWLDDRHGDRAVKGLRGHLRALWHERRVTTGLIKAAGGALGGLALAAWAERAQPAGLVAWRAAAIGVGGAVIALSANTINLLDLRPLRAIKGFALYVLLVLLLAALLAPARLAAPVWLALPAGALVAYTPLEARCRTMLGDTGANPLGALAGLAAVWALPPAALALLAAALLALHLFAERHSITAVIAAHPLLDRLDRWGWADRTRDVA